MKLLIILLLAATSVKGQVVITTDPPKYQKPVTLENKHLIFDSANKIDWSLKPIPFAPMITDLLGRFYGWDNGLQIMPYYSQPKESYLETQLELLEKKVSLLSKMVQELKELFEVQELLFKAHKINYHEEK